MLSNLLWLLQTLIETFAAVVRWVFVVVIALLIVTACGIVFLSGRIGYTFLRLRGPHHVLCPESATAETIRIYALRSAVAGIVDSPKGVVRTCSRWPERSGCEQQCLAQIPGLRCQ